MPRDPSNHEILALAAQRRQRLLHRAVEGTQRAIGAGTGMIDAGVRGLGRALAELRTLDETKRGPAEPYRLPYDTSEPTLFSDDLDRAVPVLLFPVRLETCFAALNADESELRVRILPDVAVVDAHDELLSCTERNLGVEFWQKWPTRSPEHNKQAFNVLIETLGALRGGWAAAVTKRLVLDGDDEAALVHDGTAAPPRFAAMPKRFAVWAYRGDAVYEELGKPTDLDLALFSPLAEFAAGEDLAINSYEDFIASVPPALRWMVDFECAETLGMAMRVGPFPNSVTTFDRVIALGVCDTADADMQAQELEHLLIGHRYSHGFSLLPVGSATNNDGEEPSAYQPEPPVDELYEALEATPPPPYPDDDEGSDAAAAVSGEPRVSDGEVLARALGISAETFWSVPHAAAAHQQACAGVNEFLYPITWGYHLAQFFRPAVTGDDIAFLREHFVKYVRARGPLPSIRVGSVPYGILPITPTDSWVPRTTREGVLVDVLNTAKADWLEMAEAAPSMAQPGDPRENLFHVMSQQPVSNLLVESPAMPVQLLLVAHHLFGGNIDVLTRLEDQGSIAALLNRFGIDSDIALSDFALFEPVSIGAADDDTKLVGQQPLEILKYFLEAGPREIIIGEGIDEADRNTFLYRLIRRHFQLFFTGAMTDLREQLEDLIRISTFEEAFGGLPGPSPLDPWILLQDQIEFSGPDGVMPPMPFFELPVDGDPVSGFRVPDNINLRRIGDMTFDMDPGLTTPDPGALPGVGNALEYFEDRFHPELGPELRFNDGFASIFDWGRGQLRDDLLRGDYLGEPEWRADRGEEFGSDPLIRLNPEVEMPPPDIGRLGSPLPLEEMSSRTGTPFIDRVGTYHKEDMRRLLRALEHAESDGAIDIAQLSLMLRGGFDTASHRCDAWLTSLASYQLDELRQHRRERGIYMGMYGMVENLVRRETNNTNPGGFLLAPSPDQAKAGAILRGAHLDSYMDDDEGTVKISLDAERVRLGRELLEGGQAGYSLGRLIGYRFERAINGTTAAQHLPALRRAFPISTTPQDGDGVPNDTVDGLDLWNAYRGYKGGELSAAEVPAALLDALPDIDVPNGPLAQIANVIDAAADQSLFESTLAVVKGDFGLASSHIDAATGKRAAPPLKGLDTPWAGRRISVDAVLSLSTTDDPSPGWAESPLGLAFPEIESFVAVSLGDPSTIRVHARFREGFHVIDEYPSIADLGMGALEFMLAADSNDEAALGEMETRVLLRILRHNPDRTGVELDLTRAGAGRRPVFSVVPLIEQLRQVFNESRALRPAMLEEVASRSGTTAGSAVDISDIAAQTLVALNDARIVFQNVLARLGDATTFGSATPALDDDTLNDALFALRLLNAASAVEQDGAEPGRYLVTAPRWAAAAEELTRRLGIAGLTWMDIEEVDGETASEDSPDDGEEWLEVGAVVEETRWIQPATVDEAIERLAPDSIGYLSDLQKSDLLSFCEATLQALYGVKLPVIVPVALDESSPWRQSHENLNVATAELESWFFQNAQVAPRSMPLEQLRLLLDDVPPLTTAQSPYVVDDPWFGGEGADTLSPDVRGIVFVGSVAIDQPVPTIVVDTVDDVLPASEHEAALACHFDQPSAEPPSTCLLVVPPEMPGDDDVWDVATILAAVHEALDMARIRLVDPDLMKKYGDVLPAIYFADEISAETQGAQATAILATAHGIATGTRTAGIYKQAGKLQRKS